MNLVSRLVVTRASIHSYFSNKWFIKRFFIKETETRRGRNYFTLMTGSTSMKVASPSFILPMEDNPR
jgi:hypothetical protein